MMHRNTRRAGFTLLELLVVLTILVMLAGLTAGAVFQAQQIAAGNATTSTIRRVNTRLMFHWEQYRHRRVPVIRVSGSRVDRRNLASDRLLALWDLQRMELPQRMDDISTGKLAPSLAQPPAISRSYYARVNNLTLDGRFEPAECLYLIMTVGLGGDGLAAGDMADGSVADNDNDGAPEIVDGWGTPLLFYRWAPGFVSDLQPSAQPYGNANYGTNPDRGTIQSQNNMMIPDLSPDPLNPLGLVPSGMDTSVQRNYALVPLVVSAGPDKTFNLSLTGQGASSSAMSRIDPYAPKTDLNLQPGALTNFNGSTIVGQHFDNLHNHMPGMR